VELLDVPADHVIIARRQGELANEASTGDTKKGANLFKVRFRHTIATAEKFRGSFDSSGCSDGTP